LALEKQTSRPRLELLRPAQEPKENATLRGMGSLQRVGDVGTSFNRQGGLDRLGNGGQRRQKDLHMFP